MAAARPQVTVFNVADGEASKRTVGLPVVFTAPIRTDVVQAVHTSMNKNKRQAYAVYKETGLSPPCFLCQGLFFCRWWEGSVAGFMLL